ncbi:unnamed protein product [Arctogadus glacialis]
MRKSSAQSVTLFLSHLSHMRKSSAQSVTLFLSLLAHMRKSSAPSVTLFLSHLSHMRKSSAQSVTLFLSLLSHMRKSSAPMPGACNRNLREGTAVVSTLAIPVTVSSSTEEEEVMKAVGAAHVLKSPWRVRGRLQRAEVRKLRLLFSTHGVKGGAGRRHSPTLC